MGGGVPLYSDEDNEGNPWGHEWMQEEPEESNDEAAGDARPDWEQSNT